MTRQAYIDRDRRLMIFWSPKCGCTALVKWWWTGPLGRSLTDGTTLADARRVLREEGHRIKHLQLRAFALADFTRIAVARHPFDRAVSSYLEKFVFRHGQKPLDSYAKLNPYAADFWRQIRGVTKDEAAQRYDGLSFTEFLTGIETAVTDRSGPEPDLNHHWNTQVPLAFADRAELLYDTICDVGDLDTLLADLNRRYGFDLLPGTVNATVYGAFDGRFLGDASSLELARDGRAVNRENFRSPETEAIVRRAYDIDFRTLGYMTGAAENAPDTARPAGGG